MSFGGFIKQNFALCVGIGLPVVLVAAFLATTVIPKSLAVAPRHKLAYTTVQYGAQAKNRNFNISIEADKNGKLFMRLNKANDNSQFPAPRLFIYDPALQSNEEIQIALPDHVRGQSEEIPLPETVKIKLSTDIKSPDGYAFEDASYSSSGFIMDMFGGGRSIAPRVVKGSVAYKLPEDVRYNQFRFLGWVTEDSRPAKQ